MLFLCFAGCVVSDTLRDHVAFNTLRTGDADLRLYAYKQFKYPVPNVLRFTQSKKNGQCRRQAKKRGYDAACVEG
jgi:hypothetical protein